ncbi:MAG: acetylxylan esterase [Saprospiraceae bacterium]|nr:acetylxylan esterase [Saprospiraceae bacterium]
MVTTDPRKVKGNIYDVANFIPNIQCPVLVGVGLFDETFPPEGILAGMNQMTENKEILLLPRSQHQDWKGSQVLYRDKRDEIWLPKLKAGKKSS